MSTADLRSIPSLASGSVQVKRYSKLTASEKRAHVESYLQSKQTQQAYCDNQGLKLSSFKNWMSRYSRNHAGQFTPVITTPKAAVSHNASRVEICKGDCKIVLYAIANVEFTIEIIKGVLSCSSR